jgi:hypothetical protein
MLYPAAWMGVCNLARRQDGDHAARIARFACHAVRAGSPPYQ